MAVEKKFLKKALNDIQVKGYLEAELKRAGVSSIEIQKTPIATRITLRVEKPGVVVGKKGAAITTLSENLTKRFGIENPQLEVIEVLKPELDAKLVAERIGRQVEMRGKIKQILRFALKDIMGAGAIGAEIRVAGKIVGKGGKARVLTVRAGYLKKSGEPTKLVKQGRYVAYLKAGAIGIKVQIVPPGTVFPDQIKAREIQLTEEQANAAATENSAEALSEEAPALESEASKEAKKPRAKPAKEGGEAKKRAPRARRPKPEDVAAKTKADEIKPDASAASPTATA